MYCTKSLQHSRQVNVGSRGVMAAEAGTGATGATGAGAGTAVTSPAAALFLASWSLILLAFCLEGALGAGTYSPALARREDELPLVSAACSEDMVACFNNGYQR